MANYDNTLYTYAQVLAGQGYYMKDDLLREAPGVETMQTKLNIAGFSCGTPDGKFDKNTDKAVKEFQRAQNMPDNGKAGKSTLARLDIIASSSSNMGDVDTM